LEEEALDPAQPQDGEIAVRRPAYEGDMAAADRRDHGSATRICIEPSV
jgi:hypothetical protein